jgi:hypothetical protein
MSIGLARRVAAGIVLGLLGAGVPAAAQSSPELPETSPFRTGPVSFYPSVLLQDVGLDSNVYNSWTNPQEDFTFTISPRLQAGVTSGSVRVVTTGSAGFAYYQTFKDQQAVNGATSIKFERLSGRLRPFGGADLLRARERRGEDMDVRVRSTRNAANAGADVQLSPVTALTAWVRRDQVKYDDTEQFLGVSLAEQLNSTSQLVAGGAKFAVTPLTTITVAAEYQRDRFQSSPVRDSNSVRVASTVDFDAAAIVTGRASLGFRRFMPLDTRLPASRSLVGSASLSHTLMQVTRFDVTADRDIDYSFDPIQPFFVRNEVRLTVSQRIAGPFEAIGITGRRRVRYEVLEGAAVEPRRESTNTFGGGVAVRVGEDMRFMLTYDRATRRATGSGREYERRRVLGSITYLP